MHKFYIDNFAIYRYKCQAKARGVMFFAHASGISARTYESFLHRLSKELSLVVYAYDMRGFGFSNAKNFHALPKNNWLWDSLSEDHARLLEKLKAMYPEDFQDSPLILLGHSLGAWITLLASNHIKEKASYIAVDPPLYGFFKSLTWAVMVCLGLRRYHEIGHKVRKRRKVFPNNRLALRAFKRAKLMRHWPEKVIYDYIEGTFESDDTGTLHLRHDPHFEAMLFEAMPTSTCSGIKTIEKRVRQKIEPVFIVGEESQTCSKETFPSLKRLFMNPLFYILKKGDHMFPMENERGTVSLIKDILNEKKIL